MLYLFVLEKFGGVCCWFDKLKSIWLFENILLLYDEVVVVNIIKLIKFVVNGILINVNNFMNGLLLGSICC